MIVMIQKCILLSSITFSVFGHSLDVLLKDFFIFYHGS